MNLPAEAEFQRLSQFWRDCGILKICLHVCGVLVWKSGCSYRGKQRTEEMHGERVKVRRILNTLRRNKTQRKKHSSLAFDLVSSRPTSFQSVLVNSFILICSLSHREVFQVIRTWVWLLIYCVHQNTLQCQHVTQCRMTKFHTNLVAPRDVVLLGNRHVGVPSWCFCTQFLIKFTPFIRQNKIFSNCQVCT